MWCVGNKREMTFAIYLLTDFFGTKSFVFLYVWLYFRICATTVQILTSLSPSFSFHDCICIGSIFNYIFPFVARVLCSYLPQWLARGHNILLSMMIGFKNVLKKISSNKSSENRINQKGKVFWMEWRKKCRSVRFAWFGLLVRSTPMLVRDK